MKNNVFASSLRDGQPSENGSIIRRPFPPEPLSDEDRESLRQLAMRPDEEINTDDIPELAMEVPSILNPYVGASARLKKAS